MTDPRAEPVDDVPDYDLRIATTVVTQAERDFMEQLRPMLGRSPRSLTRYVNIFRLLKAVEMHRLSREGDQSTQGEPVADEATMFLLAVLTGYPDVAQALLTELARATVTSTEDKEKLTDLVQRSRDGSLSPAPPPASTHGSGTESAGAQETQWDLLLEWLADHETWTQAQDVRTWGPKAQVVARYSFRSDVFTPHSTRPAQKVATGTGP